MSEQKRKELISNRKAQPTNCEPQQELELNPLPSTSNLPSPCHSATQHTFCNCSSLRGPSGNSLSSNMASTQSPRQQNLLQRIRIVLFKEHQPYCQCDCSTSFIYRTDTNQADMARNFYLTTILSRYNPCSSETQTSLWLCAVQGNQQITLQATYISTDGSLLCLLRW